MIDPETNEIAVAIRALALGDTLGHSVTTEQAHAQAKEILIELQYCRNGEIKRRAQVLTWCIIARSTVATLDNVDFQLLNFALEGLRAVLELARNGFADVETVAA